ncbi:MAG: hypothetical protein AMXMBFR16_12580 [Candidatus Uhrbacteria bacterium]
MIVTNVPGAAGHFSVRLKILGVPDLKPRASSDDSFVLHSWPKHTPNAGNIAKHSATKTVKRDIDPPPIKSDCVAQQGFPIEDLIG